MNNLVITLITLGVLLLIITLIYINFNRDNYSPIPKNCEKSMVDNCFSYTCSGKNCSKCSNQKGVENKLRTAGCTSNDINNWCANRKNVIKFPPKLDPKTLLNNLRTAYETGNGVMITTESFPAWSGIPQIDASASIVKKGQNVSLFNITDKINFGYIWNPEDNLGAVQCTYATNANSIQRVNRAGKLDRCAPSIQEVPHYPIICGKTDHVVCNLGNDPKCPNNSPTATGYLPCGANGMCPTSMCKDGENCIDCMLRNGTVKNYKYSNYQSVSCPIPVDPINQTCGDNEVVFDRNRRFNVNYPLARFSLKQRSAPEPSALLIAINNDFGWNPQELCVNLFPTGGPPNPGTIRGKPPVFEWIKSQFSCDTIVVVILCNKTTSTVGVYKDIVFVSSFRLQDIQNKICIGNSL